MNEGYPVGKKLWHKDMNRMLPDNHPFGVCRSYGNKERS